MAEGGHDSIRGVAKVAAVGTLLVGAGAVALDRMSIPVSVDAHPDKAKIQYIDTGTYLVKPEIKGYENLKFRSSPKVSHDTNGDNIIDNEIVSIDNVPWDGHSAFKIKNAPVVRSDDPNGDWLALIVEEKSMLGVDTTKTLAFINIGRGTEEHIDLLKDGDRVPASTDMEGSIVGMPADGPMIPAAEIGKISLIV